MKKVLFLLAIVAWAATGCRTSDNDMNNNPNNPNNSNASNGMQDQGHAAPSGGGTKDTQ